MEERTWSSRVIRRYALIQIPGIVLLVLILFLLRRFLHLPGWAAWLILGLWVVKDVVLFPFVWRAYDRFDPIDRNPIIGARGTVVDPLDPAGYVRVGGERWRAENVKGDSPVERGGVVTVLGVRGLTLIVEPVGEEEG